MKLTKIALGVSIGIGSLVANAADVAMFPYIIDSPAVTTVVTVIDRSGDVMTRDHGVIRYDEDGNPSEDGGYLHWRLHYKEGASATTAPANNAPCEGVHAYISTTPGDIKTVEMGSAKLTSDDSGLMFEGSSADNRTALRSLARADGDKPWRGVLFVHNADDETDDYTVHGTVQGEAMIFEFASGASWGYNAEISDSGGADDADDFIFAGNASNAYNAAPTVTLMPPSEVISQLMVTPVSWEPMLGQGGSSVDGWDNISVKVGLRADMADTVAAFDRDGNPVYGGVDASISCVGVVKVFPTEDTDDGSTLVNAAAKVGLSEGGYGSLSIMSGSGGTPSDLAVVYKVEYNRGNYADTLNGRTVGRLNFGHKL